MKISPIEIAYNKLTPSIINTAINYVEGTNILVRCLACNSDRTEVEVVQWLTQNSIPLKGLEDYRYD